MIVQKDAYYMLKDRVNEYTHGVCCTSINTTHAVKITRVSKNNDVSTAVDYITTTTFGQDMVYKGYIDPTHLRPATEKEKRRTRYVMREFTAKYNPQPPKPRRAASKAKKRKRKGF